jgi:hypothetical protein
MLPGTFAATALCACLASELDLLAHVRAWLKANRPDLV